MKISVISRKTYQLSLTIIFGLLVWQMLVTFTGIKPFILPGPARVFATLWQNLAMLAEHARFTLASLFWGILAGTGLGITTALQLAMSPLARRLLRPLLVFGQAIPIFALAPIITLWLGYGAPSKILMVALMIYFPITSAFFDGLMRLPAPLQDLSITLKAKPLRALFLLRIPNALPALGTGLRLASVYAAFAAVIGEWVGSSRGLGYIMLMANGRGQVDLMFAALLVLAAISVALFVMADAAGRRLSTWAG